MAAHPLRARMFGGQDVEKGTQSWRPGGFGERLAEIGAVPSIGNVGDSFDNALAETVNGYYKSELIYGPARTGPWKTVEDVELATLSWVHWHNTRRLHGYLNDIPPAEFEAAFYATERTDQPLVEIQ